MNNILKILLPAILFSSSLQAQNGDCLEEALEEMNDYYRTGTGCDDGIFNAMSSSMLGWGVGLFAGIALLTGLVHNAHQDTTESDNTSGN